MTKPSRAAGFTLIELIVSVALFGLVIGVMALLQASSLRNLGRNMDTLVTDGNAVMVSETLKKYASAATFVELPSTGSISTQQLLLWQNLDPLSRAAMTPDPVVGAYFCVDGSAGGDAGNMYLYTTNAYPMPSAVTSIDNCGTTQKGIAPLLLGGGVGGKLSVQAQFARPSDANNVLNVWYEVDYQPPANLAVVKSTGAFENMIRGGI